MRNRKSRPIPLDLRGLGGHVEIFRISGALERDPAIDLWFANGSQDLRSTARDWFARMRQCGEDVRESMHDGCPVACVEDAPFAYVNTFKTHLNVGFFYGAMLEDPAALLQGTGKRMRHVKLRRNCSIDAPALNELIAAAYLDIKVRLAAECNSKPS